MEDDVIVIGAGPAGSTISVLQALQGQPGRLFEKDKFPRRHVGESLLPFCPGVFRKLGVLAQMEKHFVCKPTMRTLCSDGKVSTKCCFNHVIADESFLSFLVGAFGRNPNATGHRLIAEAFYEYQLEHDSIFLGYPGR